MDNYKIVLDRCSSCKNYNQDFFFQKFKMAANMAAKTVNIGNLHAFYWFLPDFFFMNDYKIMSDQCTRCKINYSRNFYFKIQHGGQYAHQTYQFTQFWRNSIEFNPFSWRFKPYFFHKYFDINLNNPELTLTGSSEAQ